MRYVLITLSGGIIDQVIFYDDPSRAIQDLAQFVKTHNMKKDDAAVYDSEGLVANAKHFLDDHDEYIENRPLIAEVSEEGKQSIYIIANPCHSLGFLVISPYEPLGYDDPLKALSVFEKMRKEHGTHITLYRVEPVKGTLVKRADLEKYNADRDVGDFKYSLIDEYLN